MKKYKYRLKETSITAGVSTSNPSFGSQYSTPKAFKSNYYTKKLGYKLVKPQKLAAQSKAIDTKYLWGENNMYKYKLSKTLNEADPARLQFQEKRIAAFKEIEEKLNNLYPLIDNAKEETIAYYKDQPQSYSVVIPTDLILEYLNDIETLLKQNDR